MNILLTNDDGYDASGITELHKSLSKDHNVYLIAPKENCSGMSAAISLRKEIEVKEISKNIFSVDGTPADCSYLGLLSVIPDSIEMIVSGINLGANLGEDIFYSGTVGAAIAGLKLRYPPIAFSVASYEPKDIDFIAKKCVEICQYVRNTNIASKYLVNVNFPDLSSSKLSGTKLTMLGKRGTPDTPDLIGSNNSSKFYNFGPS